MATIMNSRDWINQTKRGVFKPRSDELKKIDEALEAKPVSMTGLQTVIEAWMRTKTAGWRKSTRNSKGTVAKLYEQVCSSIWIKTYTAIPSDREWQRDTTPGLEARANDFTLKRIDELIAEANKTRKASVLTYLKTQLFFTTDTWLRLEGQGKEGLDPRRYPPVHALFTYVVGELCRLWDVSINVLPQKIEEKFGQEISTFGRDKDKTLTYDPDKPLPKVKYLTCLEAKKYQLVFGQDRRVYQYTWWDEERLAAWELVPADSSRSPGLKDGPAEETVFNNNLCGFSMSMDRRFYVGPHRAGYDGAYSNFYHSSYLAGQAVLCAGELKIEDGVIKEVTNDSGHYQPSLSHLINVLEALRMYGIDVKDLDVGWLVKTTARPPSKIRRRKRDLVFEKVWAKGGYLLKSRGTIHTISKAQSAFNRRQTGMPRPNTLTCPRCGNKFVTPRGEYSLCPHCNVQLEDTA